MKSLDWILHWNVGLECGTGMWDWNIACAMNSCHRLNEVYLSVNGVTSATSYLSNRKCNAEDMPSLALACFSMPPPPALTLVFALS